MTKKQGPANRYERLIERVFFSKYKDDQRELPFERKDIEPIARSLKIPLPKNLGDVIYSFRYRAPLPESIRKTAPPRSEWIIAPAGRSKYAFVLIERARIAPTPSLAETKILDSTPGIIERYALTDEQALLAKVRYNRLVDIFSSVTCYSLQNHLRTTVKGIGQVETDEVYTGVDRRGAHYVFPVQAKRGTDSISVIQIQQDLAMCREKWPGLLCRPIGAQLMKDDLIALFELEEDDRGAIRIVSEKHYRLVSPEGLSPDELESYRKRTD